MASLNERKMRDIVVNAEYVNFLLELMRKYSGKVDIPEILYYEVLYTSKYLKKHGIMEEAQSIMGVWLDGVDLNTLYDKKIKGIEDKKVGRRQQAFEDYQIGGIEYYIKKRMKNLFVMALMALFIVFQDYFFYDILHVNTDGSTGMILTFVTLPVVLVFAMQGMLMVLDIAYISLPVVRLAFDENSNMKAENLFSKDAMLACNEYVKTVNAVSVSDKIRYFSKFDKYSDALHNIEPRTYAKYDKLSDIELEVEEEGETKQ